MENILGRFIGVLVRLLRAHDLNFEFLPRAALSAVRNRHCPDCSSVLLWCELILKMN
jgi:hypothetical protein